MDLNTRTNRKSKMHKVVIELKVCRVSCWVSDLYAYWFGLWILGVLWHDTPSYCLIIKQDQITYPAISYDTVCRYLDLILILIILKGLWNRVRWSHGHHVFVTKEGILHHIVKYDATLHENENYFLET